jgi:hypothetical protein
MNVRRSEGGLAEESGCWITILLELNMAVWSLRFTPDPRADGDSLQKRKQNPRFPRSGAGLYPFPWSIREFCCFRRRLASVVVGLRAMGAGNVAGLPAWRRHAWLELPADILIIAAILPVSIIWQQWVSGIFTQNLSGAEVSTIHNFAERTSNGYKEL